MNPDSVSPKEKSVDDLLVETLEGEYDDDLPWRAVESLRAKGTPEVFQKALDFCKSDNSLKRARGISVLGQLGVTMNDHTGPYLEERLALALELLSDDTEKVVVSAAWALSHMHDNRAKTGLLSVRRNANADVRKAVAVGLAGETSPEAVEALIELMQDHVCYVREWATFSLGRELSKGVFLDSGKIREALHARLSDPNEGARGEAIWGLALRKDPVGLRMLLERL